MVADPEREAFVTRQELQELRQEVREEVRWAIDMQRSRAPYVSGRDFWAIVTVGAVLAGLLLTQTGLMLTRTGSLRSELNGLRSDMSTQITSLRTELNEQLGVIRKDIKDLLRMAPAEE